ncbi:MULTISPECIES: GNAT family N-acetyltransferase [Acutalibacteraceae]|uniref:GNAT family N-acetyltransferase n=1 Tax=Acutalibacteraceae TaxID=3082771 RepID=UPI00196B4418|nr:MULTISPECIES: GNAT family N-acetyltransferase [Acutalibacteraceae]
MALVRFVRETDAEKILDIYRPYIMETAITFEEETPSPEEFRDRILTISEEYPYLVCESDGAVAAYAYASRYQKRASYRWNAELSVYVERSALRRGYGKTLYGALLEMLRLQGVQNVYAIITVPNRNSEKMHESLGFRRLGEYRRTGFKRGGWHDVALFEKSIGSHGSDPAPMTPIRAIDRSVLNEVLSRYSRILETRS